MKPIDVMFTEGLKGLNWQVHVLPLSLSMSSLPPILPVLAVPPLLVDEVEPHAAARTPATISRVIGFMRRVFGRHVHTIRVSSEVWATTVRWGENDPRPVIYRKATLTSTWWSTIPCGQVPDGLLGFTVHAA